MNENDKRDAAFKTASCNPNLKGTLPDDFITEWVYVDLHPPGSIRAIDGWQFTKYEALAIMLHSNDQSLHRMRAEKTEAALERGEAKNLEARLRDDKMKGSQKDFVAELKAELAKGDN